VLFADVKKTINFGLVYLLSGSGTDQCQRPSYNVSQVAPMCPPMRAHWHHLANMIELVLPSAHPSQQPKQNIDRFSHFFTAHGSVIGHDRACTFPLIIAPSHGGSEPHLIHASLDPPNSTTQTASRLVQPVGPRKHVLDGAQI